ncbi:LuxR C-terminal-related transcriptional regulator [Streptomyces tubercidicus]|uniref:LuxR C-terminal-related transcriptional regulator n=1 Tax=Streptomyces tubercidicus TaxID=47759 RepID=UPI001FECAA9B|nr:LuxR C-terminal-related transcriptional regulator [Streptomyces tubercidicus]WAU16822.1 LuxR C-terminal-related transcriptional regulator [Streptomyces tubercidicus]
MAQELHISESTVKFHVAKILTKPGVESRGRGGGTLPRRGIAVAAVVPRGRPPGHPLRDAYGSRSSDGPSWEPAARRRRVAK